MNNPILKQFCVWLREHDDGVRDIISMFRSPNHISRNAPSLFARSLLYMFEAYYNDKKNVKYINIDDIFTDDEKDRIGRIVAEHFKCNDILLL